MSWVVSFYVERVFFSWFDVVTMLKGYFIKKLSCKCAGNRMLQEGIAQI